MGNKEFAVPVNPFSRIDRCCLGDRGTAVSKLLAQTGVAGLRIHYIATKQGATWSAFVVITLAEDGFCSICDNFSYFTWVRHV